MIPSGLKGVAKPAEWYEKRRNHIGSSDWAHILSPFDPDGYKYWCLRRLYYDKNGVKPDFPESTSNLAAQGSFLEDKIADMFKAYMHDMGTDIEWRKGPIKMAKEIRPGLKRPDEIFGAPDNRFTWVDRPEEGVIPLENKNMGVQAFNNFMDHGMTIGYAIQVQSHLITTGAAYGYLAAAHFGDWMDLQVVRVERDLSIIDLMVDAGMRFWREIRVDSNPPDRLPLSEERCGGCPWRRLCLGAGYYEEHVCPKMNLDDSEEIYSLLQTREVLKQEINEAEKEKDKLEARIKSLLETQHGDVEEGHCREFSIDYKKSLRRNFDKDQLMADDPELYRKYLSFSPSRSLRLSITKKSMQRWEEKNSK